MKFNVSFTGYNFYTVPVEASTADEAFKKAWEIVEGDDGPAEYLKVRTST